MQTCPQVVGFKNILLEILYRIKKNLEKSILMFLFLHITYSLCSHASFIYSWYLKDKLCTTLPIDALSYTHICGMPLFPVPIKQCWWQVACLSTCLLIHIFIYKLVHCSASCFSHIIAAFCKNSVRSMKNILWTT